MIESLIRNCLADRLGASGTLSDIDREALRTLTMTERRFDPGQYLLREGDRASACMYLQEGFVFRHKVVGDGGRQIISIHMPGDIVNVQNILLGWSDHNVQALTDVTALMVPLEEMLQVTKAHPQIAMALWRETLIEMSILREAVTNIGRRDARARLAHMLCELAVRSEAAGLESHDTFNLPMTQEQLGDTLGLTAVHVNRTLRSLEGDGLISRSKRSVMVANWNGLRRAGDFVSSYLYHEAGTDIPSASMGQAGAASYADNATER